MKKIMLSFVIAGSCFAAVAQVNPSTTDTSNRWNNNGSNPMDSTRLTTPSPIDPMDTTTNRMPERTGSENANPVTPNASGTMPTPDPATNSNNSMTTPDSTSNATGNETTVPGSATMEPTNTGNETTTPAPATTEPTNTGNETTAPAPATTAPTNTGNETMTPAPATMEPATQVADSASTATMPAAPMGTNTMDNTTMPRGVNNSDASVNALTRFSALPILVTYVPDAMVSRIKSEQGAKVYDITMLKTGENTYGYAVRIEEGGMYKTVMVADNGGMK